MLLKIAAGEGVCEQRLAQRAGSSSSLLLSLPPATPGAREHGVQVWVPIALGLPPGGRPFRAWVHSHARHLRAQQRVKPRLRRSRERLLRPGIKCTDFLA